MCADYDHIGTDLITAHRDFRERLSVNSPRLRSDASFIFDLSSESVQAFGDGDANVSLHARENSM